MTDEKRIQKQDGQSPQRVYVHTHELIKTIEGMVVITPAIQRAIDNIEDITQQELDKKHGREGRS